ncbi:hypothetical protein [Microbispora sp. NPDC046933]|uniref:hypothetical protein n=1 Tax=Microbispora sp. NPDC046933 TaxID=3155618 RepID=UPI0033CFFEE9
MTATAGPASMLNQTLQDIYQTIFDLNVTVNEQPEGNPAEVARCTIQEIADPARVMDARRLGALQPTRLSASRAFINTMIRDGWTIEQDYLELDPHGNGRARYTVNTPQGRITFLGWLNQPVAGNRTGRIVGTSWDMIGSLVDGIATDEQVEVTGREIHKLYEGRAPEGTLVWFRSNQSLRIFQHVRESLAAGRQPDAAAIKKVGYLMRNTGLDGNGTFGTTSFQAIPAGHPLSTSYFAQMLAAYLMRELSVDVVEELARIDNPRGAVRLSRETRSVIGVGNGSALGLVMFVYNRPRLIHAYLAAYVEALEHVLSEPIDAGDPRYETLERLLDRAISYRSLENTKYRVFTGGKEHAADLRRIRTVVRAARRGELHREQGETSLAAAHRTIRDRVSPDAEASFNTILLEIIPEYCDRLVRERLVFDETLMLDPATPVSSVLKALDARFQWALQLPLNDEERRDRVWYQSRAAEEPRSGPRHEVTDAHEVVPNYPVKTRELRAELLVRPADEPIGVLLAARPDLEYITRLVLSLATSPYAVPHADPHDSDFVPAWLIRLMNSFVHGLDRTEDYLNRNILGLIFEGAPFRDELAGADPSGWWWSYRSVNPASTGAVPSTPPAPARAARSESPIKIAPRETPLVAPRSPEGERLTLRHREVRLISGRAMQALRVPEGSWHGARDFFVSALMADPAVAHAFGALLARSLDSEGNAGPWIAPVVTRADSEVMIDGGGQSLLVLGHVLVNVLGAAATTAGITARISHVDPDRALPGLLLALNQYGVDGEVVSEGEGAIVLVVRRPMAADEVAARYHAALDRFIRDGVDLPAQAWWDVYYPSHAGMYPDTDISRQHTGTIKDVYKPGQRLTSQFDPEEVLTFEAPDDRDESAYFLGAASSAS